MSEVKDVYFIEAVGTDRVKIGRAWNPNQRRRELQTSSPYELKLLGVVFGKRHSEPELRLRSTTKKKLWPGKLGKSRILVSGLGLTDYFLYWDDLDLVEPEHAFALAVSKEHAIELIVEDFYDGLSGAS